MKKYFISSDIHSFFDEWQKELIKKGFDKDNADHILIICGDIFDRGNKPLEVYEFLISLPKERRILIRGNHEALLIDMVKRGYIENHDIHNGTADTLYKLNGYKNKKEIDKSYYKELALARADYNSPEYKQIYHKYEKIYDAVWNKGKTPEICKWISSDDWVNYYETNNHIFVHAWIPTLQLYEFNNWYIPQKVGSEKYREDWRNATDNEWEDAAWVCPWQKAKKKLNQTGKTIVCGHWHTSDFFNNLTKQKQKDIYDCPIFISKRYKLIGLDACTAGSGKVNVLVLTEEEI